jgi:hypothetical protein
MGADPSATLDGAWYVGMVSIAGVAPWAAAAAICVLCLGAEATRGQRSLLLARAVTSLVLSQDQAW